MLLQSSIVVRRRYCTVGAELFEVRPVLCARLGEAEVEVEVKR